MAPPTVFAIATIRYLFHAVTTLSSDTLVFLLPSVQSFTPLRHVSR